MQIIINIPKEFEEHWKQDRFEDTLHRLSADAHLIAGNYEQETAIMLINAFKNAVELPENHGRLIDADAIDWWKGEDAEGNAVFLLDKRDIDKEPTIIEAEGEHDGKYVGGDD